MGNQRQSNLLGRTQFGPLTYCALAAVAMSYGWGYRGTVGHEAGAMVPGALLGLVLCLASGRPDWRRRSAIAGLFAAVGWAWGGSLSYMEQTFYVLSDSFPDVLYGYAVLFFLGALWAGCGGAVLGLSLTEPRSELECLVRPLVAVSAVFLAVFLYFFFVPEHRDAYETFTVVHFHDGDWLSATLTLAVTAVYWVLRPSDRRGTVLLLSAAVAWWLGYGLLTKLGGLRLAPLHRSESWGGVLGVLIVLIVYLVRRENRAALMLCIYGCLGGGLSFVAAVFIRHPLALQWGPFADVNLRIPVWRCAELSFGFLMGLSLALGAARLIKGGLREAREDVDPVPSDVFAVFVMILALPWMNFRRHTARALGQSASTEENTLIGLPAEAWYILLGALLSLPVLFLLNQYRLGNRDWTPRSAFGKGAAVTLFLIWATAAAQLLDGYPSRASLITNLSLWLPATLATCLLAICTPRPEGVAAATATSVERTDARWQTGRRFVALAVMTPAVLALVAILSTKMQDAPPGTHGRFRFGPQAYWRQTARLQGAWSVVGLAESSGSGLIPTASLPYSQFAFDGYRNVTATLPGGDQVEQHRWFLKNQYIWLHWYGTLGGREEPTEVPLQFQDERLYIRLPPQSEAAGYLVLERLDRD